VVKFIYTLFNDTFKSSDYIAPNERKTVNNELEKLQKEVVIVHLLGRTEENHNKHKPRQLVSRPRLKPMTSPI
jgi:hypothetical protein